jgi:signal transduction histidine kinase
VLNYSRLARRDQEFTEVDLARTLAGIRADLELVIEEKKAEILADELPVYRGHALQLHQLFLNLLSNALKFTEAKPRIQIRSKVVKGTMATSGAGLNKEHSYLEIIVEDNGIGFDQEYAEQIFAIFQRLHTRNDYPGTGIGLALCKKIVENHGGTISAQSEKGLGTRFFIYLPAEGVVEIQNIEYRTRNVEG